MISVELFALLYIYLRYIFDTLKLAIYRSVPIASPIDAKTISINHSLPPPKKRKRVKEKKKIYITDQVDDPINLGRLQIDRYSQYTRVNMVSLTMNMKLMNEYNGVTCVIKVVVRAGTPHAEIAAYIISVKSLVVRSLEQSGFVRACANTPRRSVSRALNRHPSIRLFRPDLQIYDNGGGGA